MVSGERLEIEGRFEVRLPPGWTYEEDEEGGTLVAADAGPGLLHLVSFEQDADVPLDPAEELYVFLEDQGVELEEDEVEDIDLPGGELAYTEYLTEEDEEEAEAPGGEDEEPATYWLVGVATWPGTLVFCSYSCPAGSQDVEREAVMAILRSLTPSTDTRTRPEE